MSFGCRPCVIGMECHTPVELFLFVQISPRTMQRGGETLQAMRRVLGMYASYNEGESLNLSGQCTYTVSASVYIGSIGNALHKNV
jgi:hypothetical protein